MKFICTQENFNRALNIVSHVASRSTTLPILNNILIQAKEGLITLSATNLEIGIKTVLRGRVEREGVFTAQAKLVADYVNLLPRENVEVELKDQTFYLKSGSHKTYIKGLEAGDFPLIPELERHEPTVVKSAELKQALTQVLFAVTLDESRPEISGVLFAFTDKTLTLVGTDSYRLAERTLSLSKSSGASAKLIVPLRTLQELARILSETQESEARLYFNSNQILFALNDEVELISRLLEGQYPDYQPIIPTAHKTQAKVKASEFARVIKSAALFCKPGINDVKLTLNPDVKELVVLAANSGVGENTITLGSEMTGGKNEIVFNYRYLLDGLNNLGAEEALIELVSESAPGVIKPVGADNFIYIIMPIRQ